MKKRLKDLYDYLNYWGESYFMLPVMVLLLIGGVFLIYFCTGRSSLEDVGAIAGWFLQAIGICIAASLVGMTQRFLFGYRSKAGCPMADDIYDACITFALLLLFLPFVFGMFR
ncbi:MAG: hypothetical protein ABI615_03985 [Chthoniobacterales bacterium]